jgi:pimeloyl-ACP methyl ester carboxylesterase
VVTFWLIQHNQLTAYTTKTRLNLIKTFSLVLFGSVILIGISTMVILRDNPARSAIGDPHYADNQGISIQYYLGGPRTGAVVVLLASYARSGSDFNELVEELNQSGYRSLVLQARGIDGTELTGLDVTLFDYADDLAAVLNKEELLSPVSLVGHAFGNRIARAFASRYPDRVRSLVLLAAGDSGPPPDVRNDIFKILIRCLPESTRSAALHRAFFATGNNAPNYWLSGWYPRAGLAQGRATASTPLKQWAAGGKAPILVVQPVNDAAAPDGAEKLKSLYPHRVEVTNLEDAGHATLPEQPEAVSRILLKHLASH